MGYRQVTVNTSVLEIVPFNKSRTGIVIQNFSGSTVYISDNATDGATKGFPVAVGQALSGALYKEDEPADALYAVVSAGTADLRIAESFGPRIDPSERTR